jgi:hypothetical protein
LWDCWNEPHIEPVSEPFGGFESDLYCYCAHTVQKYRDWLEKRYGSIEKLNELWFRKYGGWHQVYPPKRWGSYPDMIEWRRFMAHSLSEQMQWRVEVLKESDPQRREVMSHSSVPGLAAGFAQWGCDDWLLTRHVDRYGLSAFPKWASQEMWNFCYLVQAVKDMSRGKNFWVSELQGGQALSVPSGLARSEEPEARDIRWWNLLSIALGARGIIYWQYRDEIVGPEAPGFGLCRRDGQPTPRAEAASQLGRALNRHASFFEGAEWPKAEVAILINRDSFYLNFAAEKNESLSLKSAQGVYKFLWENNILVDMLVDDEELLQEKLGTYKVVFLTFPLSVRTAYAQELKDYVSHGGVLISEACPALYNELGVSSTRVPGQGLDEVFGLTEAKVKHYPRKDEKRGVFWLSFNELAGNSQTEHDDVYLEGLGNYVGHRVKVCFYQENFELREAEAILHLEGEITGSVNNYGAGRAYLIGTFFGNAAGRDQATQKFLLELLSQEGVGPRIRTNGTVVRELFRKDEKALIVVNPRDKVAVEMIEVEGDYDEVVDILSGELVEVCDAKVKLKVDPQDAICIYLRRRSNY